MRWQDWLAVVAEATDRQRRREARVRVDLAAALEQLSREGYDARRTSAPQRGQDAAHPRA